MELNREQIINALECCTGGAGECDDCPLIDDNFCGKHLLRKCLSLIKELTEENNKLFARNLDLAEKGEQVVIAYKKLSEENERLSDRNRTCIYLSDDETKEYCVGLCPAYVTPEEIIADTVRKMQGELKKTFSALCKGEMDDLFRIIDQIAKEMIGE